MCRHRRFARIAAGAAIAVLLVSEMAGAESEPRSLETPSVLLSLGVRNDPPQARCHATLVHRNEAPDSSCLLATAAHCVAIGTYSITPTYARFANSSTSYPISMVSVKGPVGANGLNDIALFRLDRGCERIPGEPVPVRTEPVPDGPGGIPPTYYITPHLGAALVGAMPSPLRGGNEDSMGLRSNEGMFRGASGGGAFWWNAREARWELVGVVAAGYFHHTDSMHYRIAHMLTNQGWDHLFINHRMDWLTRQLGYYARRSRPEAPRTPEDQSRLSRRVSRR